MRLRKMILSCLFLLGGCSADDPTRHNTFIPLTAMEVTPAYESMAVQTVNQYRAIGDFSGVFSRDITNEVAWIIENDFVAQVSNATGSEGLVTAVSPGETSVTAMYGDFSGSGPVVVTDAFLLGVEVSPPDAQLQIGVSQQYEANGTFSDDSVQDLTSLVSWESSDPDVASIDSGGLAETSAAGTSTISATWQDVEGSATLLVSDATLTEISITPAEPTIAQGTTVKLEAEGTFSDSTTLDIAESLDWQSSATTVAIVSAAGLVTGIGAGEAEISASYGTGDDAVSASVVLSVTDAVISSINVNPANSTIEAGASQQFIATGTFSDDSQQDITDLAAWLVTDNNVGTISNTSGNRGLFISTDSGNTFIEATFNSVSGQALLTIE